MRKQRGQSLVEFAILLPSFLLILSGILDFGLAFNQDLTVAAASREAARTASILVNGGGTFGCGTGQSPNAATVDPQIVAAVSRVLLAPGSGLDITKVTAIRIFAPTATGAEAGPVNIWTYTGANTGPTVDGQKLSFSPPKSGGTFAACSRTSTRPTPTSAAPSIGVTVHYTYTFVTFLGGLAATLGQGNPPGLGLSETTIMQNNPVIP
jgi:hypothetical protein